MTAELPFLPFSRPTIDEDTIAAVGEVLRSGWITTGPKNAGLRGRSCPTTSAAARCAPSIPAPARWRSRCASPASARATKSSPRRSPGSATANVILEVGATPVFADIDPVTRNIDLDKLEAAITPAHPRHHPGLPVRPAGRHGPPVRHRRQAQAARGRGCGAGPRLDLERQAHRRLRRLRLVQLPGQQEHHHRRRRLPGPEQRWRKRAWPRNTACRA